MAFCDWPHPPLKGHDRKSFVTSSNFLVWLFRDTFTYIFVFKNIVERVLQTECEVRRPRAGRVKWKTQQSCIMGNVGLSLSGARSWLRTNISALQRVFQLCGGHILKFWNKLMIFKDNYFLFFALNCNITILNPADMCCITTGDKQMCQIQLFYLTCTSDGMWVVIWLCWCFRVLYCMLMTHVHTEF